MPAFLQRFVQGVTQLLESLGMKGPCWWEEAVPQTIVVD